MSPEDRKLMIEGMVASLSEKLADEPNNEAGWRRLIRSYIVLNRPEDAKSAIASAKEAISDNAAFTEFLLQAENSMKSTKP